MKQSPLFQLNWHDLLKGLIVAVGSAVVTVIQTSLSADSLKVNWHAIEVVAISATVAYLAKNLLTPAAPVKETTVTPEGQVTKEVINTDTLKVTLPPGTTTEPVSH